MGVVILQVVEDVQIDLIVMGIYGCILMKDFFVGLMIECIVECVICFVFVVKFDGYFYLCD